MSQFNQSLTQGEALTLQQKCASQAPVAYWLTLPKQEEASVRGRLQALVDEHDILRTVYGQQVGYTETRQQALQESALDWRCVEGESAECLLHEALAVFTQQSAPLLAWFWPRPDENRLLLVAPAQSLDQGSALAIRRCLSGQSDLLLDEPTQYLDYADWVADLQMGEDASAGSAFWRGLALDTLPDAALIEQVGQSNGALECLNVSLGESAAHALRSYGQTMDVATSEVALAVWAALLGLVNGKEEFQLSYFYDCRTDYEELEDALGRFVVPCPVPCYQPSKNTFSKWFAGQHSLWQQMLEQQEYLGMSLDLSAHARQVGFAYQSLLEPNEISAAQPIGASELLLQVSETPQTIELSLHYDSGRYSQAAVAQLLQRYELLLARALAHPNDTMDTLDVFLLGELSGLVNNDATFVHTDQTFLDNWRMSVDQYPQHQAARFVDEVLTYAQMDALSDQVAAGLQQRGASAGKIVALCLPRSMDFLVTLLGIMKTGAAYLPLDPEQPESRQNLILADAQPVLTIVETVNQAQQITVAELKNTPADFTPVALNQATLAYVLYTSGTSGTPKGVQVPHSALSHYCQAAIHALQLPKNADYALVSSPMADLGNTMLFPSWIQGGCLHLLDKATSTDSELFRQYVERYPIDCLKIVPSHFMALSEGQDLSAISPRQSLILGGENISAGLLRALASATPLCTVYNHYGPTETTVGVMWGKVDLERESARLQHVLGNNRVYLLDDHQASVINGTVGELYIAGPNLSAGYLNQAEQTTQAFVADPFAPAQTMYRSGDLAFKRADGSLEIVGRADQQIKIRGFRMELGEVESALSNYASIQQAHVLAQGEGEQKRLVAFVVANSEQHENELKAWLMQYLPDYMVPARILRVERMPLNANGKVDRHTLMNWLEAEQKRQFVAPKNEIEIKILSIWQDVLGRENISTEDNFFDLGGHSLAAIKVIARLRQAFDIELAADIMFHKQTITALAEVMVKGDANQADYLVTFSQVESKPTLVMMHSLGGHYQYYQPLIDALKGQVNLYGLLPDVALLAHSTSADLDKVIDHYADQLEALREQPIVLVGWSLAGRMMMWLAQALSERGFTVQNVAIIDFDPTQVLSNVDNEKQQLLEDLQHYCAQQGWTISEEQWQTWSTALPNDYAQGLEHILANEAFASKLDESTTQAEFHDRIMMRWSLKRMFYDAPIPVVKQPLWVWRSSENAAPVHAWQRYSSQPVQGWSIDADHFGILATTELAEQLLQQCSQY
ncbi:amino acid adenylation domain-containing protein [Marinomonas alcarazii]|uniref:Amino acid adenylation domain-containing protein n=1 Tax=Marinomonas alcarazii TaxID=491949 RepID=A0A318VDR8_9GAMM|nr:non-ribosomal peptide synthetase [Marinomonas alcarazii]PYF84505.1 amino acid adenylation domain-containing protein [Marinomonas alcarazii]